MGQHHSIKQCLNHMLPHRLQTYMIENKDLKRKYYLILILKGSLMFLLLGIQKPFLL